MDFFVYSRAAPSAASVEHDPALDEAHWSYMDRFAEGMIARGPTLSADRERWTGSMHIVDLPSADAARAFVEDEPYNRAGLFEDHVVRLFDNLLGRSMWEFPGGPADPRFLVIAQRVPAAGASAPAAEVTDALRERLIVHGALLMPDDAKPAGFALALQARTRETVEALLSDGNPRLDQDLEVQIHEWEFGGRR